MTTSAGYRLAMAAILCALAAAYLGARPAGAEQSGGDGVIVSLDGSISPRYIPRHRPAPISLRLSGEVRGDDDAAPPQLQRIEIAFGDRGGLQTTGLPNCPRSLLRDSTRRQALARCPGAVVGRGEITTEIPFDPASPCSPAPGSSPSTVALMERPQSGFMPTRPRRPSPSSSRSTCGRSAPVLTGFSCARPFAAPSVAGRACALLTSPSGAATARPAASEASSTPTAPCPRDSASGCFPWPGPPTASHPGRP